MVPLTGGIVRGICTVRARRRLVNFTLLSFLNIIGSIDAHGQAFLECSLRQASHSATKPATLSLSFLHDRPDSLRGEVVSRSWQNLTQTTLHQLGGDDLRAYFGFVPSVTIVRSPLPNAFALGNDNIVVSSGLLDMLDSRDELAFVLAHELAHFQLGHIRHALTGGSTAPQSSPDLLQRELDADSRARAMLRGAGFDDHAGSELLKRILRANWSKSLGGAPAPGTVAARIKALNETK